ncbi:MAG: hypothetical protein FJ112_10005 [Deltaproteobacteria bacterium]|nr:hypothetical protein [Deltaproteobacteria bacterium]
MVEFSYFLGIDQTGAATAQGQRAKPLKACLIKKTKTKWRVFTHLDSRPLSIESLTLSSLKTFLRHFDLRWPVPGLAIIADCVLGIPDVLPIEEDLRTNNFVPVWNLLNQAHDFEYQNAKYGREVAEKFFSRFLSGSIQIPKRQCEIVSGSNSLFTNRPFQKNIQTGSYRIWKDLTQNSKNQWLNIWPFNSPKNFDPKAPWLFESYPSLMWKEILGIRGRNSKKLIGKLQTKRFQSTFLFDSFSALSSDPDLCDALVLALSGAILQEEKHLITPFPKFWEMPCLRQEGWICGLRVHSHI